MKVTVEKQTIVLLSLFTIVFWSLTFYAVKLISHSIVVQEVSERTETVRSNISLVRAKIENAIFMDTYLAESLATFVTIDPDFAIEHWSHVVAKAVEKSTLIRHVGLAPNNIISHVYPVEGNRAAIGFDFRTNPEQFRTVEIARTSQKVFIAGPLQLVQGGEALIARFPVFSDYPRNENYWGAISVVLDYQKLLEYSGINELDSATLAIRGRDGRGEQGDAFYGSATLFETPDLVIPINLPSGEWQLVADYQIDESTYAKARQQAQILVTAVASILFLSLLVLYRSYHLAHTASLQDDLTKLPNRRYAIRQLNTLLGRSEQPSFVLLNLDLNNFKQVNDKFGHEVGDKLLLHVSSILMNSVRVYDFIARLGGDEFVIILHRVSEDALVNSIIKNIKEQVEKQPLQVDRHTIQTTVSVGYAFPSANQDSVSELMARADHNMYYDKNLSQRQQKESEVLETNQETQ
ncbi:MULTISPECIES: diguanylate cyclase [unclassified Pseudoalteromonas]|uniref:diguanylate cyclase domain-containing protein n=1 Tax=unclassified Pseudoalteromonas TaxID=194690 RepID=UPI001572EAA2|nr:MULTISPECIES: diguanylate cyclase [unclassified Pseudoalteromonas]MBR8842309.1 sensor domain-containing diguanylate cyclase [Pseudoalteromonas sp. JC3]NSY35083.1 sensor domain-containing diguanylate cyclase [Pseudoalteromonas sp. JC28]WJE09566.1 diguanylate cyclase [Pseudoalteromonas sp. JC3]